MGFRKQLDYNAVQHQIYMSGIDLLDSRNDGYTQWSIKQDLYRLSWLLEKILKESPKFVDEDKFITEHEQHKMWRTLTK